MSGRKCGWWSRKEGLTVKPVKVNATATVIDGHFKGMKGIIRAVDGEYDEVTIQISAAEKIIVRSDNITQ
jgi:transcription antitermination factor NusG